MQKMTDSQLLAKHNASQFCGKNHEYTSAAALRYAGRLAYLDGRVAMAREWNRRAGRLAKLLPARG